MDVRKKIAIKLSMLFLGCHLFLNCQPSFQLPVGFVEPDLQKDSIINGSKFKYLEFRYYQNKIRKDSVIGFYRLKQDSLYFISADFVTTGCYNESLIGVLKDSIYGKMKPNPCDTLRKFPHYYRGKTWFDIKQKSNDIYLIQHDVVESWLNTESESRYFYYSKNKGFLGYKLEKYLKQKTENFRY